VANNTTINFGLKGIVALESDISRIDGEKGILEYRGYNIHDLAKHSTYEEVAYLLLNKHLPIKDELDEFSQELIEKRELPAQIIKVLHSLPKITHPTVILRTIVSYLGSMDTKLNVNTPKENMQKSKSLIAKLPTIVAYYQKIRTERPLTHPNEKLGHAANFLYMLNGEQPNSIEKKTMDLDFILHAEHTLNASTFAARIAASTLSDMYAGVVAATGTLFGALHGGASQKSIEMLQELKDKNIEKWVNLKLHKGEVIMGFGHRVYRTLDPRAKELRKIARQLDKLKNNNWMSISDELVDIIYEKIGIHPNVDFYAASVYANLGIPSDLFINIFALSRIAGWTTHMADQYQNNKLIRPLQKYVGDINRIYTPVDKRK
jgi:citrate synthase